MISKAEGRSNLMGPRSARWTDTAGFIKNRGLITTDGLNIPLAFFFLSKLFVLLSPCYSMVRYNL